MTPRVPPTLKSSPDGCALAIVVIGIVIGLVIGVWFLAFHVGNLRQRVSTLEVQIQQCQQR